MMLLNIIFVCLFFLSVLGGCAIALIAFLPWEIMLQEFDRKRSETLKQNYRR
tara:strand:+ start:261 stop:416 length:156 start_codon:yes stop_codon:yes gene_type:complete